MGATGQGPSHDPPSPNNARASCKPDKITVAVSHVEVVISAANNNCISLLRYLTDR